MLFKKLRDEGNYLGFDQIEVIQFNYDGKGGAVAISDGQMMTYHRNDVDAIVSCNDDGVRCYYLDGHEDPAKLRKQNALNLRVGDESLASLRDDRTGKRKAKAPKLRAVS